MKKIMTIILLTLIANHAMGQVDYSKKTDRFGLSSTLRYQRGKEINKELIEMFKETLPSDLPVVFISAVTGFGLDELKDVLWSELNAESNKLNVITSEDSLVHRDKDMSVFAQELADEGEDEDIEYIDEEDIEDIEDFEYEDFDDEE